MLKIMPDIWGTKILSAESRGCCCIPGQCLEVCCHERSPGLEKEDCQLPPLEDASATDPRDLPEGQDGVCLGTWASPYQRARQKSSQLLPVKLPYLMNHHGLQAAATKDG
ncbi:hypothetical protein NDU88_001171 [Pleurodeles waltl]|uniref:Uncharacterized protein n=1 Tax=Pleurodeles waltl TaxID=8319 RepID=A0AAV7R6A6_PLEWA|nr:hypothetical protein NDU88_001171 [Pleurodeles waltl]